MEAVQLDLWEEAEVVRQRWAVWHIRDRTLEKYAGKTAGGFDLAVVEGPLMTFSLLGRVVGRRISVLHPSRLPWASLVVWEVEVDQDLRHSRQLDSASEGLGLALARICQRLREVVVP